MKRLGHAQGQVALAADAAAVANDVARWQDVDVFRQWDGGDWVRIDEPAMPGDPRTPWIEGGFDRCKEAGKNLRDAAVDLRKLATEADLITAGANLWLQRFALVVAGCAAVAALAAAVVALLG
jgi:hypothetical protein